MAVDFDRRNRRQLFLPHSRWITFSQLKSVKPAPRRPYPQLCPQAAHNMVAVLHTLSTEPSTARVGVRPAGSAKCRSRALERCQAKAETRSCRVHPCGGGEPCERCRDRSEERR